MVVQNNSSASRMQSNLSIMIEGEELEVVQAFRYLGSIDPPMGISLWRLKRES